MEMWAVVDAHTSYWILSDGRVWSDKTNRFLKPGIASNGYPTVQLDGKTWCLHRLVAEAFIPNPYRKRTVNHEDGNKLNNNIINLVWATDSENGQHAVDVLGRITTPVHGNDHPKAKLTPDIVREIRRLGETMTQRQLAKQFNVARSLVYGILKGKNWPHIT